MPYVPAFHHFLRLLKFHRRECLKHSHSTVSVTVATVAEVLPEVPVTLMV